MPPLATDEVRIWAVALDTLAPARFAEAAGLLDLDERTRAGGKRLEADRRVFELAHGLLRLALSSVVPVAPAAWRFDREPGGRPFVAGPEAAFGLHFSLSHAPGLAACAVRRGREVGLDAEDLTRRIDVDDLARACLRDEERAGLDALPPERRAERLIALFTLKEAYLKARGAGLALDLRSLAVAASPPALLRAPPDDESAGWLLALRRPAPHHVLAVAARRAPGELLSLQYFEDLPG